MRVVARDVRACAVFDNGMLQCWGGFNFDGELGLGHTNRVKTPGWVKGIRGVKKVALGRSSTCAIAGVGELYCWGRNEFLEGDSRKQFSTPMLVSGLSGVVDVAVGSRHACAVDGAGAVWCWGSNGDGQLGLGTGAVGTAVKRPTQVPGLRSMVAIAVSDDTTLALSRAGELYRWGMANDPARPWAAAEPRRVIGLAAAKRLWMESGQACALLATDEVRCFSHETLQALAAGKQHDFGPELAAFARAISGRRWIPAPANFVYPDGRGLSGVVDVVVANHDASALTNKGEVFSWGSAKRGTVGHPVKTKGFFPPTRIGNLSGIVEIAGSFMHRCALDNAGKVLCFGDSSAGRLGTDTRKDAVAAVPVQGLPRIIHLASGDHCTFALAEDHSLWAWGMSWINACGFDDDGHDPTKAPQRVPLDTNEPRP